MHRSPTIRRTGHTGVSRRTLDERYADAIGDFRRAVDIQPEYRFARYDLARALIADDQPARAAEVLADHLSRHPDDLDGWVTSGTAALLLQDYEVAERVFRHVIEHRARDAGAWYKPRLVAGNAGSVGRGGEGLQASPFTSTAHCGPSSSPWRASDAERAGSQPYGSRTGCRVRNLLAKSGPADGHS